MAQAKHKALYINLADGTTIDPDEADPRVQEETSELQSFLDEYSGGSHKISLFKVKHGTADLEWLAHYAPGSLTPEVIRDEWGPGSYSLTLLDAAGHFIRRRKFHIGGKPEDWDRARGIDRNRNGESKFGLELQMELMRQQHETMLAMITNRGGSLEETIKAFVALKENSSNPSEQLTFMTQMIQLAKSLNGNDNSAVGLIREIAPAILEQIPGVVAAAGGAQRGTVAAANAATPPPAALPPPKEILAPAPGTVAPDPAPGGAGDTAAGADVEAPAAPTTEQTGLLIARLNYWKQKARMGHDPDFWIDYVLQNDDEPDVAAVLWAIRHYEFGTIIALDPEIGESAQLRRFFLQLYDGIKAELLQSDDSGRESGDARDAPSDAGADPGGSAPTGDSGDGDRVATETPAEQPA